MTIDPVHIVGVDLSMAATGLAVIRPHEDYHSVRLVKSEALPKAERSRDAYADLFPRLRDIGKAIRTWAIAHRLDGERTLWCMEGPALDVQDQQHRHTMSWLWGRTYEILNREGAVVVIPPSSLKRYVTGNGLAGKGDVKHLGVTRAFPHIDFRPPRGRVPNDNLVDAYGLAAMGSRHLGSPVEPSVQRCWPDALNGVVWHRPRPSAVTTKGTP